MPNSFTHTSEKSWISRIIESIKSVVIGLLLFVAAFPTLFWNEGCAVRTAKSLTAGAAAVMTVSTNEKVDGAYEGKLVHMTGTAVAKDSLQDDALGVSANAIKLARSVEMYQWIEKKEEKTEKKTGGKEVTTTTYSYRTDWASSFNDTASFEHPDEHQNPSEMPYRDEEWANRAVKFGAFELPEMLVSKINKYDELAPSEEMLKKLPPELRTRAKMTATGIYVGRNPESPAVGDLKISYKVVKSDTPISIVAQQQGTTFARYQVPELDAIALLEVGTKGAQEMFAQAQADAAMLCWIMRGVGMAMMFFGMMLFMRPLVVVSDVVPLIGSLLDVGLGLISAILAFSLSFLTIAAAWIFYRPLIGIPLLILGLGSLVGGFVLAAKKRAAKRARAY